VENIKNARIRVGATHVPQLIGDTDEQSEIGKLFDSLGEFADGPFAKALRDKHLGGIKADAEQAVLEGTTLEDVEDKNFIYEHYHRGATGRKQGADLAAQVQAMYDENADDPTFNHSVETTKLVHGLLEGMDPETAENAVAVIKRTLPPLIEKEDARRTTKARLDILHQGQEATSTETAGLFKAKDFDGALDLYDAGFADAKNLDGPFDAKNYNSYIVSDFIAALQDPNNAMTPEDVDAMEASLKEKRANGSSLWTNPEVNDRLRKAFARARATKAKGQSVDQILNYKKLMASAADYNTLEDNDVTRARGEAGELTPAQTANVIFKADETRLNEAQLVARVTALASPSTARAVDPAAFDWVQDAPVLEETTRRMVEEQKDVGTDSDAAKINTALIMQRDHGVNVPWLDKDASNRVKAGDYAYGLGYLRNMQSSSVVAGAKVFESADTRAALEYYETLATANDDPRAAKEAVDAAYAGMPAARKLMNQKDERAAFEDVLLETDIANVHVRQRVLDGTIMNVSLGMSPRIAALEAVRLEVGATFTDENGTPMTAHTAIDKWEEPVIRERVRSDFLRAWMRRRGIDTDNTFSADEEIRAIILPTANGQGMVQTPDGQIVGVIPLALWASETLKVVSAEEAKETEEFNAKADANRRAEARRGAPELF
jgi:hypothetical protein